MKDGPGHRIAKMRRSPACLTGIRMIAGGQKRKKLVPLNEGHNGADGRADRFVCRRAPSGASRIRGALQEAALRPGEDLGSEDP